MEIKISSLICLRVIKRFSLIFSCFFERYYEKCISLSVNFWTATVLGILIFKIYLQGIELCTQFIIFRMQTIASHTPAGIICFQFPKRYNFDLLSFVYRLFTVCKIFKTQLAVIIPCYSFKIHFRIYVHNLLTLKTFWYQALK